MFWIIIIIIIVIVIVIIIIIIVIVWSQRLSKPLSPSKGGEEGCQGPQAKVNNDSKGCQGGKDGEESSQCPWDWAEVVRKVVKALRVMQR